jgi:hypothetical protein
MLFFEMFCRDTKISEESELSLYTAKDATDKLKVKMMPENMSSLGATFRIMPNELRDDN